MTGTAITIGTFDGVHLGHQFLINKAMEIAKNENLESLVITFSPHPRSFLNPNYQPLILTELSKKIELIKTLGVHKVEVLEFNKQIAGLEPEDFIKEILIQKYKLKHLVVGHDFAIGKNRKGDYNYLLNISKELGFKINLIPKFEIDGIAPSSGIIRELILNGDIHKANKLLGRDQITNKN